MGRHDHETTGIRRDSYYVAVQSECLDDTEALGEDNPERWFFPVQEITELVVVSKLLNELSVKRNSGELSILDDRLILPHEVT